MPTTTEFWLEIPGSSATSGNYAVMVTHDPTVDLEYETVHTRDLTKFDLVVTDELLIRNGLVETGRTKSKGIPICKTGVSSYSITHQYALDITAYDAYRSGTTQ